MSLIIWLPLNGKLNNQGISAYQVAEVGTTIDNSGKIGQCYSFNGTSSRITISNFSIGNIWSYGAWIYPPASSRGWEGAIILNTNGGDTDIQLGFYTYPAGNKIQSTANGQYNSGISMTYGQWNHLFATFDGSNLKTYINGILVNTKTITNTQLTRTNLTIGARCRGSSYDCFFSGKINDVRIYDHCLSAAEVKEIAQGLILHYKLDQDITINQNIIPNSLDMPLGSTDASTGTWRLAGSSNMTRTRVAITDTPEGNGYGFQNSGIQTANDGSCYGINSFPMEANTNYVISMWARITEGTEGYAGFNVYSSTPIAGWQVINKNYYSTKLAADGSWTKCWMSFKTNNSTTRNIYIGITTGDTSVTTQMCNVHLEKGLLIDQNIVRDSSGYNYNGTILGTPTINNNTIRYSSCTNFPENTDGILSTFPISLWNNAFTYSFWIKPFGENGGRSIYAASYNGTSCSIEKTAGNKLRFYWNGSPDLTTSSLTITDGVWQHIAVVKSEDKTKVYCYYNGELKDTFTNTFNDKTFSGNLRIARDTRGDATSYTGLMSDFRIYCTPLLDTDIKQLYNVSMKIDNQYNVHTFEMVEHNINKINKNGQAQFSAIYENGLMEKLHYDKTIYTEPDGSTWVRVFHHNDPTTSGLFVKTSDWEHGVYESANKWYDIEQIIPLLIKYEFMVKQKTTSSANETKYRWIQTANPLTCVYNDVSPGHVTINTSTGYTNSSYGGLWKMNSSARMCIANSSSSNWYGAMGSWTVYNTNNVPGYPNSNISTGYLDFYVRVYPNVKDIKNYGLTANQFIER